MSLLVDIKKKHILHLNITNIIFDIYWLRFKKVYIFEIDVKKRYLRVKHYSFGHEFYLKTHKVFI